MSKNFHGRLKVLKEIIETESKYSAHLEKLEQIYCKPLQESKIISLKDYNKIFSELVVIRGISNKLLHELQNHYEEYRSNKKPTFTLGEIFLRFAPFLKTYTAYCNNYESVTAFIRQLSAQSKEFSTFLLTQKKNPEAEGHDINSFLIMPVQRIPRYQLLLRDLLKNTSKLHRDYEPLSKALAEIHQVADHVNNSIKNYDRLQKLTEVQNMIIDLPYQLYHSTRRFIREDVLAVMDETLQLVERKIFMFSDILIFTEINKKNEIVYHSTVEIKTNPRSWVLDIIDTEKTKNVIQLITNTETFTFAASDAKLKASFIDALVEVLAEAVREDSSINTINVFADYKYPVYKRMEKKASSNKNLFSLFKKKEKQPDKIPIGAVLDREKDFPKRNENLLKEEDFQFVKEEGYDGCIGVCRAINTYKDENSKFQDEILFNNGDILLIYNKNLELYKDWWLVRKAGMNCVIPPPSLQIKQEEIRKLKKYVKPQTSAEERKILLNEIRSIFTVQSPPPARRKKLKMENGIITDVIDDSFYEGLQYNYEESKQIGLVPSKFMAEFNEDVSKKIIEKVKKRDEEEELKMRNFRTPVKKKGVLNSLEKHEQEKRNSRNEFEEIHRKRKSRTKA